VEETIIELRGNGVVITIYEIDKEVLEFLQYRANRIGEDLSQLWFDPFFWHNHEMHQIKLGLKKVQEYRGLMNDDISFMEIRRQGKRRKKYLVKELLGEGQLFPMVNVKDFDSHFTNEQNTIFSEMIFGIGCLGSVRLNKKKQLALGELRVSKINHGNAGVLMVLTDIRGDNHSFKEDFLVRQKSFLQLE
jgi:hypothetical protein